MKTKSNSCVDEPLGILCRCAEYQKIIDNFVCYNIGIEHYLLPKMSVEPIASANVLWIKNRLQLSEDISKPALLYPRIRPNIDAKNVDKMWIPFITDLIPLKYIKL